MKKRLIAAFILVTFLVTGLFVNSNYKSTKAAANRFLPTSTVLSRDI